MKKRYRNTTFLIELMVNVLVLSISCAVLVGVFVRSSIMVAETGRRNSAGNEIYALLETVKAQGAESLGAEAYNGGFLLGYDADWHRTTTELAVYTVRMDVNVKPTAGGTLEDIYATAFAGDGKEICSFATSVYRAQEAGV